MILPCFEELVVGFVVPNLGLHDVLSRTHNCRLDCIVCCCESRMLLHDSRHQHFLRNIILTDLFKLVLSGASTAIPVQILDVMGPVRLHQVPHFLSGIQASLVGHSISILGNHYALIILDPRDDKIRRMNVIHILQQGHSF